MRLLVCGDRAWNNYARIKRAIRYFDPHVLIEGGANGADSYARVAAEALGIPVLSFAADWDRFKKAAGPIRNRRMLHEGHPDFVLAFHGKIEASKGTADMLCVAEDNGVPYALIER